MDFKDLALPLAKARLLLTFGMLVGIFPGIGAAQEYFDRYGLSPASPAVDLGVQPLGYPSGVISSVMQRDRLLKKALAEAKLPLQTHPFRRGADMVGLLADRRLEAGLLGDMPTLLAASIGRVWIVGLVKQSPTAVVAKGDTQIAGLAGKRIGYVEASSAHLTLLQGLASAGLGESQVRLAPLGVADMPEALERKDIDAFAAWEPATTIALGKSDKNHMVFRGLTTDYFVIEQGFEKQHPQAALHLVAGFMRALEWMRRSPAHLEKAARWAKADTASFSGKQPALTDAQIAGITRREILDVPSAPTILLRPGARALKQEFEFLVKLGKLPTGAAWSAVEAALGYDGMARILADARTFPWRTFDYDH